MARFARVPNGNGQFLVLRGDDADPSLLAPLGLAFNEADAALIVTALNEHDALHQAAEWAHGEDATVPDPGRDGA